MRLLKNYTRTKLTGILLLAAIFFTQFSQKMWNDDIGVIAGDVHGYYAYLPALFIHNDLKLENLEPYQSPSGFLIWFSENDDGTRYIKYSCGMAILYAPFFGIAHAFAEVLGAPANGFSYPYKFALAMSAIVYFIIAFVFLSKLLFRYFNDHVVAITLLILFGGTNAFHYYTNNMTYSHGYSLALISVFLYCTVRWLETPKLKWALWIGITSGLFVLIRPIDALFLFVIPLFDIHSFVGLKERFLLFWRYKMQVLVMVLFFLLMLAPQLAYFKYISGNYLFYSYNGESFYFDHLHLFDSLFSYRNGWLVYSPMMLLSFAGLFFLRKQKAAFGTFLIPISLIYIYIISSWWCWWYVGFGNRAFINLYPLLAFSLACFVHAMISKGVFRRTLFKLFVLLGVVFSAFQTYQYDTGAINWGAMTKEAYWDSFLRERPSQLLTTFLRYPVTEKQILGMDVVYEPHVKLVYSKNYNFENKNNCDSTFLPFLYYGSARNGKGAVRLEEGMEYLGKIPFSVKGISTLYISAWVQNLPEDLHLTLSRTEPVFYYQSSDEEWEREGNWSKVHLLAWIPENFEDDSLDFVVWNQGKHGFILDDLEIKAYKYTYIEKER